jgi:hypothetical protein
MTINGVSSSSGLFPISSSSSLNISSQNYKKLEQAISDGNLTEAQSALASIQGAMQKAGANGAQTDSKTAQAVQSLQTALQSGDTTAAQKAMADLKQDLQSVKGKHHHHHHKGGVNPTGADPLAALDGSSPTTTPSAGNTTGSSIDTKA